ncbi:MAG: hypothetical protein L0Y71_17445 [Gemmataceae bacterium]|nr:hypothetical protein [Gemmataceae bacterium]
MVRRVCWAAILIVAGASWGHGGPVDGQVAGDHRIGPGKSEPAAKEFTLVFRGGERACVTARGDHNPVVPLDVTVYDKDGVEVAKDASNKDYVAIFWTPPRTAEYRIVVRNHGVEYNDVYVVFK